MRARWSYPCVLWLPEFRLERCRDNTPELLVPMLAAPNFMLPVDAWTMPWREYSGLVPLVRERAGVSSIRIYRVRRIAGVGHHKNYSITYAG